MDRNGHDGQGLLQLNNQDMENCGINHSYPDLELTGMVSGQPTKVEAEEQSEHKTRGELQNGSCHSMLV